MVAKMGSDELKPWRCKRDDPSSHIMGWVRDGSLVLLRQAIDICADEPVEVDVMATVEGSVMEIRCSVCGGVRSWHGKTVKGQRSKVEGG